MYFFKTRKGVFAWLKERGIYVGLPSCIEFFDELAAKFIENPGERENILKRTENEASKIETEQRRVKTSIYVGGIN